jgi:enterochelin esterase-like enzyme
MHLPDSQRFHVVELPARPLYVYLPEAAAHARRRKFPVIYCQDGQNIWDDPHCCFGHGGWYLNRIVDQLAREGKMEPVILVGIPNSDQRYREYAPGRSYFDIAGHSYASYVRDVVKPHIEKTFPARRTAKDNAVLGSSLGGLVALWMAHHMPDVFGKAACLSGAFQVRDRQRKSFADFVRTQPHRKLKVYLDSGTVDDGVLLTCKVRDAYLAQGWKMGKDLMHFEDRGAEHNERFWRDRVWRALTFLFGATPRG